MRVLLDECLPRRLGQAIIGHEMSTVPEMGWAGLRNHDLLGRATGRFDAFVTVDQAVPASLEASGLGFAIVVLKAPSNRLNDLLPIVPRLLAALASIKPGEIVRLS